MCGFAGIYHPSGKEVDKTILERMSKMIDYRGPDDEGFVLINSASGVSMACSGVDSINQVKEKFPILENNIQANVGLGFRRLSILDLSEKGHQPMSNADGTIWIVFNGEIYNYVEIRAELEKKGYRFQTGTDTEVIIQSYTEWGESCLSHFNGMWSFAIWDNRKKHLFCARDRFGIKPFHYYWDGETFVFGSEIKQVLIHLNSVDINHSALARYFHFNGCLEYGDETLFSAVKTLPNGHMLLAGPDGLKISRYYDLNPEQFETYEGSLEDAGQQYLSLFKDAVRLRMRSDVEVGSCLSGGLDSSAIVCEAANFAPGNFKAFNAYFEFPRHMDERKWVQLVCEKSRSIAHYISPTPEMLMNDYEQIIYHQEIPLTTSSPFSQYYVMQLARQNKVTVLLDGQGSDEMTGGYHPAFYRFYADLIKRFKVVDFHTQFPAYLKHINHPAARFVKTMAVLLFSDRKINLMEIRNNEKNLLLHRDISKDILDNYKNLKTSKLSNYLYNILMNGNLQTLLHLEDRNSMAFSIESRVPFLDYRLVEFCFSLPSNFKIRKNLGKLVHRKAIEPIVPIEIANRKDKIPFLAPGESIWLKNEMKDFAKAVIYSNSLHDRGFVNTDYIKNMYEKYIVNGNPSLGKTLWKVISFEIWCRVFLDNKMYKSGL